MTVMKKKKMMTMMSIKCNTICRNLPRYECYWHKYIEDDVFQLPPAEQLESTIIPNEQSFVSRLSDDLSATDTLSDYRQCYMMLENNYDDSHCVETSLMNKTEIVSAKELKIVVLKWKSSCMSSFSTFGRNTLHGFLSWHVWFERNINKQILERYRVTVNKQLTQKKEIYNELYTTFSKLKLSKFYKATSNTMYSDMIITKKSFDTMIKAAMLRKHVK